MDFLRLCTDFGIATNADRPGWINIHCPFCAGSKDFHLGYNADDDYFTCWRCGWKAKEKAVGALTNVSLAESSKLIERYGGKIHKPKKRRSAIIEVKRKGFKYPTQTKQLIKAHRRYLTGRNFNPNYLIEKYKIMATGPTGNLDAMDMKWRLIIPIIHNEREVSWQSRSIKEYPKHSRMNKFKYITCPPERERIFHKALLYNYDSASQYDWCIVCEGIFDVWRLGDHAVCTFGTKYKIKQMQLLQKFKVVFICYDPDTAGQENAKKLKAQLEWAGVKVQIIKNLPCDPGDMNQEYANKFVYDLKKITRRM